MHNKTRTQGKLQHRLQYSWSDWPYGDDWKKMSAQTEKINDLFVKNIVLTKNWFVVSVFHEIPEHHMSLLNKVPQLLWVPKPPSAWVPEFPSAFQVPESPNVWVPKCLSALSAWVPVTKNGLVNKSF